jgi:hypothetical protein
MEGFFVPPGFLRSVRITNYSKMGIMQYEENLCLSLSVYLFSVSDF